MEHASSTFLQAKRYAVVTGANKGIGFEICKQLASKGVVVVLTARDEKRGLEAVEKLKESEGLSDFVIFHQLDVADPASIASLAHFIKTQFGKLDILVNNAAYSGVVLSDAFVRAFEAVNDWPGKHDFDWNELATQNFEMAEECLKINYYGAKRMTEAHISLLQLSDSPRIVNVSSSGGLLKNVENEYAKTVLNDIENLTEEKIDELLNKFMKDFKEGSLEKEGWRTYLSAYTVSKAALNAYTRLLAKKYPDFLVNSVCPGYVKTDITCNTGLITPPEGAHSIVRYAVVTGANKGIGFEICKQLASKGVVVVLTSRDEKRGLEAVEKLKESEGLSDYVIFHQLDVTDPASIASLADFIKTHFGKLDILVNNAGIPGAMANADAFVRAVQITGDWPEGEHVNWKELATQTFETAEECLNTNYYGAKRMVEALAPLLQLSDSARIVNISSFLGLLERIPNEKVKGALSNVESLTEEKIDEILNKLLKDVKEGSVEKEGWPSYLSAYSLSKAAMNAYTRILAKKNPTFLVNCVCPGFVKTDMSCNAGPLTVAQGADGPVKLALLPYGGSSGLFFRKDQVSCF